MNLPIQRDAIRHQYPACFVLLRQPDVPFTKFAIAASLDITPREVEKQVEALRCKGAPIIAGDKGLEWTTDFDKHRAYIESRWRRQSTIRRNTQAQARFAHLWFEGAKQIELFEEVENARD